MIEMVAVTPLLLLLLLGVSELGKALVQYNTLNKSVREAAREVSRYALLGTTGNMSLTPELIAEGKNLVVYGNVAGLGQPRLPELSASHVSVTDAGNNLVLIRASYPYKPIFGAIPKFGNGDDLSTSGITLTASVMMRAL
jgi:hypothetical protein